MDERNEDTSESSFCLLENDGQNVGLNCSTDPPQNIDSFTEYREREIGSESMGSGLFSVHRSDIVSPSVQEWLDSNNYGREGIIDDYFTNLGTIVRSILRVGKRKRILHDIISGDVGQLSQYITILEDRIRNYSGGFVILAKHFKPEWEHLHIIHDCNFYNSQCRCSLLHGITVKSRRGSKYCRWSTELTEMYIKHLTIYLSTADRNIIQIKIGGQTWRLSNPIEDIQEIGTGFSEFRQVVDACEEENTGSIGPSRRSSNESVADSCKRIRTSNQRQSKFHRRGPTSHSILQWFKINLPSPANNAPQSVQWINDPVLNMVSRAHKEFKEAIDAYDRWLHIKTIEELYETLKQATPIFSCLDGNFDEKYYSIDESIDKIMDLLNFQFHYDEDEIKSFIHVLYNILNRNASKKNCICIIGTVSAGKTLFARFIKSALLSYGQVCYIL